VAAAKRPAPGAPVLGPRKLLENTIGVRLFKD
jgi:hypothetical protein